MDWSRTGMSEAYIDNIIYTSVSVYYDATSSVHMWVCETDLFYTYERLYPIQLLRKTQTNEVSCSALSHKRIPLMLINSLVRWPAKTSPWESGKSGLRWVWGTYRVYSSHTQLNLSTSWPKHPTLHQHHLQTKHNSPWVIFFKPQIVLRSQTSDWRHKVWSTPQLILLKSHILRLDIAVC